MQTSPWLSVSGEPLHLDSTTSFTGRCTPISKFEKLNRLGEGTYGVVYRARDTRNKQLVALKQVRILPDEGRNGIPITALREISILCSLKHANIVNVVDVAIGDATNGNESQSSPSPLTETYMVMEYVEQDLANLIDELNVKFTISQVKCLFRQLLEGLEYLHRNDIIHRDVKLQNILLTAKGVLKLADFGMAREYSSRPLTPGVVTIWYRAPELLLGTKYYTPSVDLWAAGLVLAELLVSKPCLPGETVLEQLSLIVKLLGTPEPEDMASLSEMGCPDLNRWQRERLAQGRVDNLERRFLAETSRETVNFLRGMIRWDPKARWTASESLGKGRSSFASMAARWWKESPREIDKDLLPTFPEVRNSRTTREKASNHIGLESDTYGNKATQSRSSEVGGYVFDFGGEEGAPRPAKKHRKI